MNPRKQLIEKFSIPPKDLTLYMDMKECFEPRLPDEVDEWFKGVIESLYYKPNHKVLFLESKEEEDCWAFFYMLVDYEMGHDVYDTLIKPVHFHKNNLDMANDDNFKIDDVPEPVVASCDKRLASYCSADIKWTFPKRKNYIVVPVNSFDMRKMIALDKDDLWRGIFFRFKPKPVVVDKPKCKYCINDAREPHTCPCKEEIDRDSETLCNCCHKCEQDCIDDL